jgi:hypothetical protein
MRGGKIVIEGIDYVIKDFYGYIAWIPLSDSRFEVDPTYIKQFIKEKSLENKESR